MSSLVEQSAIAASLFSSLTATCEGIKTIVVDNFPALGKLTALRFIEWTQKNRGGVVALPTGKTPEHFIHLVAYYLRTWDSEETRNELKRYGIDPSKRPDIGSLHFVQIDEFYPIDPAQRNSFYAYVQRFYIGEIGMNPENALFINCEEIGLEGDQTLNTIWPDNRVDISLRYRASNTPLEQGQQRLIHRIDQWCQNYERRIRDLGGIGFFLGGIGPDGHIGFNVRGSDHYSTTRLAQTNYETQAAASVDLGGIENSRKRLAITIGLGTITWNRDCVAIIMAAGETKARVVAEALCNEPNVLYPATALRKLPQARFYLTMGASKRLVDRRSFLIEQSPAASDFEVERSSIDLSLRLKKSLDQISEADVDADPITRLVFSKRPEASLKLLDTVRQRLIERVEKGSRSLTNTRFLHTEPHHDDIMLGYLPGVVRNIRQSSNHHEFVTLTSGFTSVTHEYMLRRIRALRHYMTTNDFVDILGDDGYFDPHDTVVRNRDVWQYLDGVAAGSGEWKEEGSARRLYRNLIQLYEYTDTEDVKRRLDALETYFLGAYPGKKDPEDLQRLKGMCREWEAECLWGYFGWNTQNVHHLRLGFYTGDIFTEEPTVSRDIPPILQLLRSVQPNIISVAFDPESSGPDTHYKVLQALNEAVHEYTDETDSEEIRIWGYRNVWYRFHPGEANIYVPVSLNMFSVMDAAFSNTFISQTEASFPSYEYDGPFSELAQRIQVEQYQMLKTCLGRSWFNDHSSPLIRATRGFVFLREMSLSDFFEASRELKRSAENR